MRPTRAKSDHHKTHGDLISKATHRSDHILGIWSRISIDAFGNQLPSNGTKNSDLQNSDLYQLWITSHFTDLIQTFHILGCSTMIGNGAIHHAMQPPKSN
eukprot:sb/3478732/